jgi:hypothetical protein
MMPLNIMLLGMIPGILLNCAIACVSAAGYARYKLKFLIFFFISATLAALVQLWVFVAAYVSSKTVIPQWGYMDNAYSIVGIIVAVFLILGIIYALKRARVRRVVARVTTTARDASDDHQPPP